MLEKEKILGTSIFSFSYNVFFPIWDRNHHFTLANNKFLDWSKFKAFADDKLTMAEKLKFVLGRVENIVGKGENAFYQHFLLFSLSFQEASIWRSLKVGIVW